MKLNVLFIMMTIFALTAIIHTPQTRASSGIKRGEMRFTAQNAADNYPSPIIKAPLPFNAVFSEWSIEPSTAAFQLQLRTSKNGEIRSDWQLIEENQDWTTPDSPKTIGEMFLVPLPDTLHRYFQYRLTSTSNQTAVQPELNFVFMDSSNGLTSAEMTAAQEKKDAKTAVAPSSNAIPKPTVVSRDVWCADPDCNYAEGLEYSPVTHLIVHHTAGGNYGPDYDWGSVVRAIWEYHTYDLGWGDIGYNYLVDPNGVLYEGHLGGDDVIGVHASEANTGSMALSLMGNFSDIAPSNAMLNASIDLLAWKADQKEINVFDSGNMPNLGWGLPYLSGHRDVYGGAATQCPGEKAHELLPWLRQEVANRVGFIDPNFYSEETSSEFSRSDPDLYWWTTNQGCGYNRNAFYTWSVTNPAASANWGEWRPTIEADGRYQLDAYIPYCATGRAETEGAVYEISHADGVTRQTVSQNDYAGLWLPLGEYDLLAGQETLIRLTDLTTTDSDLGVWFDSLRLQKIQATARNLAPAINSWQTSLTVPFLWELTEPNTVQTTTLQIGTDADFNDIVFEDSWNTAVFTYSHTFDQDYASLYWRTLLQVNSGETRQSTPTSFGLDTAPPNSLVTAVYQIDPDFYILQWTGNDTLSGLARYTIEYQAAGAIAWTPLFTDTTNENGLFTPPITTATYFFRSQATDNASNIEPPHEEADTSTENAILLGHKVMLPIMIKDSER